MPPGPARVSTESHRRFDRTSRKVKKHRADYTVNPVSFSRSGRLSVLASVVYRATESDDVSKKMLYARRVRLMMLAFAKLESDRLLDQLRECRQPVQLFPNRYPAP